MQFQFPSSCSHGWDAPVGELCPECLYNAALRKGNDAGTTRELQDRGWATVLRLMPNDTVRRQIEKIARDENYWKARKEALIIRQAYLYRKNGHGDTRGIEEPV